jgi:hypothetical protein
MCRVAVVIDRLEPFKKEAVELLDLTFVRPVIDAQFTAFSVEFGEHGLMGIEFHEEVAFGSGGRLIEVAVDVANADRTKDILTAAGYQPVVVNPLPAVNANEYLFGRDFHGIPLMVCTAGDNEKQMRVQGPFRELDAAPLPKVGCVTVRVKSVDKVAADLERYFGMKFIASDPAGLGTKALTGEHRIKLVEGAAGGMEAHFQGELAAIEIMSNDVASTRKRMEKAGYPVVHRRVLRSGAEAYYFGSAFHSVPLSIYPASADGEILGRTAT